MLPQAHKQLCLLQGQAGISSSPAADAALQASACAHGAALVAQAGPLGGRLQPKMAVGRGKGAAPLQPLQARAILQVRVRLRTAPAPADAGNAGLWWAGGCLGLALLCGVPADLMQWRLSLTATLAATLLGARAGSMHLVSLVFCGIVCVRIACSNGV
jgi:hypothetical protein